MNAPATIYTGPLGSTIHVLRADAGTIAELAAIDWNRCFRRVCLDPVRGVITLMAPSFSHEDLARILDSIVDDAGDAITGATKGLRSTRLRGRGEPPSRSSNGLRPIWWWRSRSRTPMKARPNATARWGCGSCGVCTPARARGSCGRTFSPWVPGARRVGSELRRCWKG